MHKPVTQTRPDAGLSLLELVVAILILSIAVISTYRVVGWSGQEIGDEAARFLALNVAHNHAEELRLATQIDYPEPSPAKTIGQMSFSISTEFTQTAGGLTEATITVSNSAGPGALLVTYLPSGSSP